MQGTRPPLQSGYRNFTDVWDEPWRRIAESLMPLT